MAKTVSETTKTAEAVSLPELSNTALLTELLEKPSYFATDTSDPKSFIDEFTAKANVLAAIIEKRQLYQEWKDNKTGEVKRHVKYEGWCTLGAMLGIVPMEREVTCNDEGVYVATVELVELATGRVVGRATHECGSADETDHYGNTTWASRAAYARRSMAVTRAGSKAYRQAFAWVLVLAGFAPTPAEELDAAPAPAGWGTPQGQTQEPAQPQPQKQQSKGSLSEGQVKRFYAIANSLANSKGINRDAVIAKVKEIFSFDEIEQLDRDDYQKICTYMIGETGSNGSNRGQS